MDRAGFTKGRLESTSGPEKIYYRHFCDSCEGMGLVILHDFYDYHGRYGRLISSLTEDGVSVGILDFKGHGLSMGTRGHMDNFDAHAEDLVGFMNKVLKRDVVLVAQGSGVLVALRALDHFIGEMDVAVRGLVASNPLLGLKREGYEKGVRTLLRYGGPWASRLRLPYPIVGNMLTNCPESAREHDRDPLIGHYFSLGLFKEMLEAGDRVRDVDCPVPLLLLLGQEDSLCDREKIIRYHNKNKGKDQGIVFKDYPNMKHDLFNDSESVVVFKDIKDWLKGLS